MSRSEGKSVHGRRKTREEIQKKARISHYRREKLVNRTRAFFRKFSERKETGVLKLKELKILLIGPSRSGKTSGAHTVSYNITGIRTDYKTSFLNGTEILEEAINDYSFTRKHCKVYETIEEALEAKANIIIGDEEGLRTETNAKEATTKEARAHEKQMRVISHRPHTFYIGISQSYDSINRQTRKLADVIILKGTDDEEELAKLPSEFSRYKEQISKLKKWEAIVFSKQKGHFDFKTSIITLEMAPHFKAEQERGEKLEAEIERGEKLEKDCDKPPYNRFSKFFSETLIKDISKEVKEGEEKERLIEEMEKFLIQNGFRPGSAGEDKSSRQALDNEYSFHITASLKTIAINGLADKLRRGEVDFTMSEEEKLIAQERHKSKTLLLELAPSLDKEEFFKKIEKKKREILNKIATSEGNGRNYVELIAAYNHYYSQPKKQRSQRKFIKRYPVFKSQGVFSENLKFVNGILSEELGMFIQELITKHLIKKEGFEPVPFNKKRIIGGNNEPDLILIDDRTTKLRVFEIKSNMNEDQSITYPLDDFFTSVYYMYNWLQKRKLKKSASSLRGLRPCFYLISINYVFQTIGIVKHEVRPITIHHQEGDR